MKYFCLFLMWPCLFFAQCTRKPDPIAAASAAPSGAKVSTLTAPIPFDQYWYQGKAELTAYDVEQERYGAMRKAEQIDVFVTEDFSKARQVKLDQPADAGADRVPVLKRNTIRRYHTGIYDYSMMQSVFTPVAAGEKTLKTTCTVQDWCGHVFTQYNLKGNQYRVREFSYFEEEGDSDRALEAALLEDELWTRLRLDPASIPVGKVRLVPDPFYARLRHKAHEVHAAVISRMQDQKEGLLKVEYEDLPRTLVIRYEAFSPYRIIGWEETDQGRRMSRGTRKATRMSAYWAEHDPQHDGLRDSLQLTF